jgi:hypothetical protein
MTQPAMSMDPDDAVMGGGAPLMKNLEILDSKFAVNNYNGAMGRDGQPIKPTAAIMLLFKDDEGTEYLPQYYSCGNLDRVVPSEDGKNLRSVVGEVGIRKGTTAYYLLEGFKNCQFPAEQLKAGDITVLKGTYAWFDGFTPPKLNIPGQTSEPRAIPVPTKIHRFPWEAKVEGGAPPAPPIAATTSASPSAPAAPPVVTPQADDLSVKGLKVIALAMDGNASIQRSDLGTAVFHPSIEGTTDEKSGLATYVFGEGFKSILTSNGYVLDGETITKA